MPFYLYEKRLAELILQKTLKLLLFTDVQSSLFFGEEDLRMSS